MPSCVSGRLQPVGNRVAGRLPWLAAGSLGRGLYTPGEVGGFAFVQRQSPVVGVLADAAHYLPDVVAARGAVFAGRVRRFPVLLD